MTGTSSRKQLWCGRCGRVVKVGAEALEVLCPWCLVDGAAGAKDEKEPIRTCPDCEDVPLGRGERCCRTCRLKRRRKTQNRSGRKRAEKPTRIRPFAASCEGSLAYAHDKR
ncbi:MAG TPA: hypothetical protein VM219_08860 [Phycisphaerae bacterium]|nr:hypothetical protein [Phycisphaerae bacterium]